MNTSIFTALTFSLSAIFIGLISPAYADEPGLSIENAWIAEAPPVSRVMVAYMTIRNTSPEAIEIVRAESAMYSSIEFHETRHQDEMAKMIRHDSLIIPANEEIQLKRGAKHLMLFNPEKPLKTGDIVTIELTTKNDTTTSIPVIVKKASY